MNVVVPYSFGLAPTTGLISAQLLVGQLRCLDMGAYRVNSERAECRLHFVPDLAECFCAFAKPPLDKVQRQNLSIAPDMKPDVVRILEEHGIHPSAQRVAVAEYVLHTREHPSADKVWAGVQKNFPMISRATVYNTLNLFVEKGCFGSRSSIKNAFLENA